MNIAKRLLKSTEFGLFALLLASYAYFLPRWADWNANSRFYLVRAVVEKGTIIIDDYNAGETTGDYATVNGHTYSDKAPGLSFAAVPVYGMFNAIARTPAFEGLFQRLAGNPAFADTLKKDGSGLRADKVYAAVGLTVVTFFMVMLPSALLGVMMYSFLGHLGLPRSVRLATPLIYGLATLAFPYSGAFYGHQFAAVLLFTAFFLAYQMRRRQIGAWAMLPIGFLLSSAIISEYPTGLIAAAIALYAVYAAPDRRWTLGAIVAGLPPLVLLGAYNMAIFGTPFKLGYEYSTLWQGEHSVGFLSLSIPTFDAVWGITFGSYRGLYFVAPILLVSWPGLIYFWKVHKGRSEWAVTAWAIVSFMLFNASSIMWQGGFSVGPRYLAPMLPFAAIALAFGLNAAFKARWSTFVVAILAILSLVVTWAETIGGQAFPDYTSNPLFSYSLPNLLSGNIARNVGMAIGLRGWGSLAPLVVLAALIVWWLFRKPVVSIQAAQTPLAVHKHA